jgi:hypothetical protein
VIFISASIWLSYANGGLYGIAIGQINLIAIWMALAPANIVQRLSWSLLLMVWMWYSYTVGYCWWNGWFGLRGPMLSLQYALVLGLAQSIGFLEAQIPLWIGGQLFGWRLVNSSSAASPSRGQFNLRHLLWAMVVTALIIVPGRFIVPPEGRQTLVFDGEMVFVLSVLGIANVFIMIPAIWLAFSKKWPEIIRWFAGIGCCAIMSLVEYRAFVLVRPAPEPFYYYLLLGLMNVIVFAIVYGTLRLLRAIGFQLILLPSQTPSAVAQNE